MKLFQKKVIDYIKNNRNKVIFYAISVMLSIVVIIILIKVVSNEKGRYQHDETGGDIEVSEDITDVPEEDEDVPEHEDIPDDPQDPQKQGTTGVELNIKDMDANDSNSNVVVKGIDVAKWQGIIDWKQVKESDITFAMIRVGYRTLDNGVIVEDPYAKYNLQEAEKNGIKIGVYFFSTAINEKEAIEEAKWVAGFIASYSITYPVAYNCEGFNNPNNRQYGMSKNARTAGAIAFLDRIKQEGYTPMFYASRNEMENDYQWNTSTLSQKYKIWVAQYPNEMNKDIQSDYTGRHDMWQFTSKGIVQGIDKPVDLNLAYFDYDTIAKPKGEKSNENVSPDPAALIKFEEVNELVTAKVKTNLRYVPSSEDSDTIAAVLVNKEIATRTGIGQNGWSRLEYNGETLYAVTSYLTTDLDYGTVTPTPTQEPEKVYDEEKVTAKYSTHLRTEPSTQSDDTIVTSLKYGDVITRIGIENNNWSKVEYNGRTLYALSDNLTTDLNYQENNRPSKEDPEAGKNFVNVEEKVTAKIKTNLRSVASSEDESTIEEVLYNGDVAIRTGIEELAGDDGWSRVEYNGKTLYAVTRLLTKAE